MPPVNSWRRNVPLDSLLSEGQFFKTIHPTKASIRGLVPTHQLIDSSKNAGNQISYQESSCQVRRSLRLELWRCFPWFGSFHVCTSATSKKKSDFRNVGSDR